MGGNIRLEMPQPDYRYGYLPSKKARLARLEAPFTIEEENIMNRHVHLMPSAIWSIKTNVSNMWGYAGSR